MPYVEDIVEPLITTLTHTGGLSARQLVGHAANLEFWVGEVEHAFKVIDGYGERFKNLQRRQSFEYHPFRSEKPLRPGMSDHELKELRRRLTDSVNLVLSRSYAEGFVSEKELEEYGERLGLDTYELKRKKKS
ncbi:MAG: hypothetical protein ACO1SV_03215 [Fimbriimonas sp.]